MSTLRVNTIQNQPGTGAPSIDGLAKAWVNFNGTGTVAIRASFNVTSITDNGTGDYTVNFTVAMSDTSYATSGSCNTSNNGSNYGWFWTERLRASSTYRIACTNVSYTFADMEFTSVSVFR
jgi:hypothetical protein